MSNIVDIAQSKMDTGIKKNGSECASDTSEEFYDAPEAVPGLEDGGTPPLEPPSTPKSSLSTVIVMKSHPSLIDSENIETRMKSEPLIAEKSGTSENGKKSSSQIVPLQAPMPPPRTRKKKHSTVPSIELDNAGNQSSGESKSMTNSVESTTPSYYGRNLASILDDIPSIKGDLSIGDMDDKRSIYPDDPNLDKRLNNPELSKPLIFSNEQLQAISKNMIKQETNTEEKKGEGDGGTTETATSSSATSDVLKQVVVLDLSTGETVLFPKAENILPKCLNPLSLHLMKITNEEFVEDPKQAEKDTSATSLADSTFKSVTSLISNLSISTLNEMKGEKKVRSLDKNKTNELIDEKEEEDDDENEDEDDNEEEKNSADYKDGRFRSKFRGLKRLGTGLIKGVKGVKAPSTKKRSTFHVEPGDLDVVPPAPPRYKMKVNHKRGSADFDGLKQIQEISDFKGAIWCMKFSKCGQLLAAAGQDHLLRVYCAQKSWKYFTQLRHKASGQHISPNSTKERAGSTGDSFNRHHRTSSGSKSFSRTGSLNACDSHNNSSSSSNSSALAKEFYKDEDNTLSEEGPLLLFSIYRGHTADVLDLAWSKNHFLLSSSMDKTVRLWHITRIECLCTFRHIDFVTTIQFHPMDDRYFLSGSLDGKLRLWNIPDKRVTLWNEVPSLSSGSGSNNNANQSQTNPSNGLITASSFAQNGKFAVIGTYDGRIIFYATDQLKYFTQIHVSQKNVSQSGATKRFRPNKVTGIESIDTNNKILVTTNDSRLRLYDLRDLSLTCKFKGCLNQSSQIKASVSHDHRYIICGSENNSFYIWRAQDNSTIGQRRDRNKQYECFRLLNVPAPTIPSSLFEPVNRDAGSSSSTSVSAGQGTDPLPTRELDSTSYNTVSVQLYSNSANKIVTSAIFAPVPGVLEEKARYIIAVADFNGYIRIFSKY